MNNITAFSSLKNNTVFITTGAKWSAFSLERARREWNSNFNKWEKPNQAHCKKQMIKMVNSDDFTITIIGKVEAVRVEQNIARNSAISCYEAKGWDVLNY